MSQLEAFKMDLATLEEDLLTANPGMKTMLAKIHKQLRADPEIVTILEEDDVATIINGLATQVGISLQASIPKKAAKKTGKLQIGVDL